MEQSNKQGLTPEEYMPFRYSYNMDDIPADIVIELMNEFALVKMIQENESLLEMAKLHMDSRAVMVIQNRIKELENLLSKEQLKSGNK